MKFGFRMGIFSIWSFTRWNFSLVFKFELSHPDFVYKYWCGGVQNLAGGEFEKQEKQIEKGKGSKKNRANSREKDFTGEEKCKKKKRGRKGFKD